MNFSRVIAPAHQRLESDDVPALDVNLGLEGAAEAAIADRQAQALLQLHPGRDGLAHMQVEVDRIPLGVVLGAVHRAVGVTAQFLIGQAVLRMDAHPDGGRGEDLERFDVKRLLQVGQDLLDDRADLLVALDRIEQQQEFIPADARQHVAAAQPLGDAVGDLQEQRIADGVAIVVVDVLEVVEVDEGEREPAFRIAENPVDMLPDENAVRQAGQVVEVDALQESVLDLLAIGDVERAGKQQGAVADAHRLVPCEPGLFAGRPCDLFLDRARFARSHEIELPFAPVCGGGGVEKIARQCADQFMQRERQAGRRRGVGQDEAAVGVLHRHRDREMIDDLLEHAHGCRSWAEPTSVG